MSHEPARPTQPSPRPMRPSPRQTRPSPRQTRASERQTISARQTIKEGLARAFDDSGLLRLLSLARRWTTGPRIHVLGYHRVVENMPGVGPINRALCISVDAFRRQMEQARERFIVLSLSEVARVLRRERILERDACAITFDDGYRDVLVRAHPVLRALGLPAAVFVPTGFCGSSLPLLHDRLHAALYFSQRAGLPITLVESVLAMDSPGAPDASAHRLDRAQRLLEQGVVGVALDQLISALPARALMRVTEGLEALLGLSPTSAVGDDGARVLDPVELRTLSRAGWEIGAHTVHHVVLTHEPIAQVSSELEQPRRELEAWTGAPCRYFAYCNGLHSHRLRRAVKSAGYEGALTTFDHASRPGDDPFRIGRKVMWETHARDARGHFSPSLSAAHLHDLFGALGLRSPIDGELSVDEDVDAPGGSSEQPTSLGDGVLRDQPEVHP